MSIFDPLGQNIATIGQVFGLPEMGWSEGKPGQTIPQGQQTQPYVYGSTGGAYQAPSNAQVLGEQTGPTYGPTYNGPVQGPTYSGPTGGTPTGGTPTGGTPTGGGTDELSSQLDSIFSPVFNALQGQENTLNANYASVPGEINAQYQNSADALSQQKTSGMADLNTQETQAGTRKEDALTSATRLYNELSRGGQQRFGGASSAGEAYGALTAVEQQRRQATIQSAYETAMQQVGTYKTNLNDKYALAVQDLETQKNSALNQAQRDFRDSLQQIQSSKAQAQSDKATASMNALQDLRNKVYTINQQSLSFTQQLALNKEVSLKAVDDYTSKVAASLSGAQVATTNFANQATLNPTTSYGISSGQTSGTTTQQTGNVAKTWKQDENGNWVYA